MSVSASPGRFPLDTLLLYLFGGPGGDSPLVAIFLIHHKNFGIDFGTTNSAVSRMDGHEPVPLKFGDAQQP